MPVKMARSAPPDNRSGCPMPLVAPSRRGCLAARPEIRGHSRQIGSHLGNPGLVPFPCGVGSNDSHPWTMFQDVLINDAKANPGISPSKTVRSSRC